MPFISRKNPSYLIKHRRKWQVKLTIPKDVRWAFDNQTTYKRSTGCDIEDVNQAIIKRDTIVAKFQAIVELHRSSMPTTRESDNMVSADFKPKVKSSGVEGWIKERLLNKSKNTRVLRYDFWNIDKKN